MIDLAFLENMQAVASAYNDLHRNPDEVTSDYGCEYGVENLPAFPTRRLGIFHEPTLFLNGDKALRQIGCEDDLIALLDDHYEDDEDSEDDEREPEPWQHSSDDPDDPLDVAPASAPPSQPAPSSRSYLPAFVGMGRSHARLHARHEVMTGT